MRQEFSLTSETLEFSRRRRAALELPLTAFMDVVFILIVFFMLTTTFMRVESLELLLPGNGAKETRMTEIVRVILMNNGEVWMGPQKVKEEELAEKMQTLLKANPNQKILLLSDTQVSMQKVVNVMDKVYQYGGKSLLVRELTPAPVAPQRGR